MLNPANIRLANVRTSAILAMGAYLCKFIIRTAADIAIPAWLSPMKKMKLTIYTPQKVVSLSPVTPNPLESWTI
jgi:hypothetical protein